MVSLRHHWLRPTWTALGGAVGGVRVSVRELDDGIVRIQASSRLSRQAGMRSSMYLVGDVLVDTGFSHAADAIVDRLSGRDIRAIACTHHHEDHTGNAAALAAAHGCPVYLRHPEHLWTEGVGDLLPYRRFYWGEVAPFAARPMPDALCHRRTLEVVDTPGHSSTHVVLYERKTGVVLSGDLFVSTGASALMAHESPSQIIASLRRVADLRPRRLLSGHGLVLDDPAERLLLKAERMEKAADRVRRLHREGVPSTDIPRRVFRGGWATDRWGDFMTQHEFSRLNFVNAVLREPSGAR